MASYQLESDNDTVKQFIDQTAVANSDNGASITWLNHFTVVNADWDSLQKVDFIGIDGTLLQLILRICGMRIARTSADLILPTMLRMQAADQKRIGLLGGKPGIASGAGRKIPGVIYCGDGYADLQEILRKPQILMDASIDTLILGLGAGLQDQIAVQLREKIPSMMVVTAGGWLDQMNIRDQYFPDWIHRFRLGWAWRLFHEPKRLYRRYTVDAVRFLYLAPTIIRKIKSFHAIQSSTVFKIKSSPSGGPR